MEKKLKGKEVKDKKIQKLRRKGSERYKKN